MSMQVPTDHGVLQLHPDWEFVSDRVMGGVSKGTLSRDVFQGRGAVVLRGDVRLDNDGGFVQIAFDLHPDGTALDASGWTGLAVDLWGNGAEYDIRLRTDQLTRPWQSFRMAVATTSQWQSVQLPFSGFVPHKTDATFDPARLRRVGILAIGAAFQAEVAVARVGLYR